MIKSPCKKICIINKNSNICKGCYRTLDEISNWIKFDQLTKKEILDKVEVRKTLSISNN